MTPKEKAIELYNKMYETGFKPKSVLIRIEQAKECALIAVDEILEATKMHQYALNTIPSKTVYNHFWSEVKKEISKL
jgi:hypothetical protein